jgi:hypothetical protein
MNSTTVLKRAICALIVLVAAGVGWAQQSGGIGTQPEDLARRTFRNVRIEAENIGQLFAQFASAYDVPVGLEVASSVDERGDYRIMFEQGALSDLLAQFVRQHDNYEWKIENGVVHIFPKQDYRVPIIKEFLATELGSFSIKEGTSAWSLAENLLATPEVSRTLNLRGINCETGSPGGFYIQQLGQHYTLDVTNTQLKTILDRVIKESPVARSWIISSDPSTQKLFLRVNARPENTPKNEAVEPKFRRNAAQQGRVYRFH